MTPLIDRLADTPRRRLQGAGAARQIILNPYPVQRGLTAAMREAGAKARDVQCMQVWAGQAAAFARAAPAAELVRRLWQDAEALLPSVH